MNVSYRTVLTSMIQHLVIPLADVECMRPRIRQVKLHFPVNDLV